MTPYSLLVPTKAQRSSVGRVIVQLVAAVAVLVPNLGAAQVDAPGEPVTIPGTKISGVGQAGEVPGRFGRPVASTAKVPAVLILHGGGGVDGRGAFYAKALQEAGIATLEIAMFTPGGSPEAPRANLPHAAAALKWLAAQPSIDGQRLGVMGFSWGGVISLLMASELVQELLGKDVPKPAAFAPFYPICSVVARNWLIPQNPVYNAHTRMGASPMLIQVGTRDDYEDSERGCDAFVATWPAAAREHVTVRYFEGATHAFDVTKAEQFNDSTAHGGRGGMVTFVPSPKDAAEARQAVVRFFVKNLNR